LLLDLKREQTHHYIESSHVRMEIVIGLQNVVTKFVMALQRRTLRDQKICDENTNGICMSIKTRIEHCAANAGAAYAS